MYNFFLLIDLDQTHPWPVLARATAVDRQAIANPSAPMLLPVRKTTLVSLLLLLLLLLFDVCCIHACMHVHVHVLTVMCVFMRSFTCVRSGRDDACEFRAESPGGYPEQLCHGCGRPGHKKHECPSNVFGNTVMGMSSFGGGNIPRRDGDWDCMTYGAFFCFFLEFFIVCFVKLENSARCVNSIVLFSSAAARSSGELTYLLFSSQMPQS